MKTTIDLSPDLVREMKLLAIYEGRKLKDVVADLFKRGLKAGDKTPKFGNRQDSPPSFGSYPSAST